VVKSYKGRFRPKNPEKYKGDLTINKLSVADGGPTDSMLKQFTTKGTQLMSIYQCNICNKSFKSLNGLGKHVSKSHDTTSEQYYNNFHLKPKENICQNECGNKTDFISITFGYKKYCNTCSRSLGAKKHRKRLKEDELKFKQFSDKVSENQRKIWKCREIDGTAEEIKSKIGQTISKSRTNMTKDERSKKFGWLNKLEEHERLEKIEIITEPLKNFWKDPNNRLEKTEVIKRRSHTMKSKTKSKKIEIAEKKLIKRYGLTKEKAKKWYDNKYDKESYYKAVWEITNLSYFYCLGDIDPLRLRGKLHNGIVYVLDHILSIMQGFLNDIDPYIIGHPCNLQILENDVNLYKSANCWITFETLNENIKRYNLQHKNKLYMKVLQADGTL